jgi:hypothetical protein
VLGNDIVGNTRGLVNRDTAVLINARNNYWGDASGPTHSTNPAGTGDSVTDDVTYKPWLETSVSAGAGRVAVNATSLDAQTACGVIVSGVTASATEVIMASKYTANPKTAEPDYDALADGWYDVYVLNPAAADTISIKLYNDAVTKDTDAQVWSTLKNKWVDCTTQGASETGGFVYVTVTSTSTPNLTDLGGLPFVLVEAPAAAYTTLALTAPPAGETDTLITNVAFTWASYIGATAYEVELSAEPDLDPTIAKELVLGTAYTYPGTLEYSSAYYWRVTAMRETTIKAQSDINTFTTMAKPAPTVVPAPQVTVESPPPTPAP